MAEQAEDAIALMEEYQRTGDVELRNRLVMHYSYIPKVIAAKMRGLTNAYAQLEDLVNQGMLTLIDCVEKFSQEKGMKFESYAFMRVKGANIDFIRKQDWLPRRVRKTARDVTDAYNVLANQFMREPTTKELADYMDVPESTIERHFAEISNSVLLSFENLLQGAAGEQDSQDYSSGDSDMPENSMLRKELREQLAAAIEGLTERERLILSLYYHEHLRLCEIAKVLSVSESRVSQMHSRLILKLRNAMTEYEKG